MASFGQPRVCSGPPASSIRGGGSQCSGEACAVDHRPPAGHDVVAQLLRGQALVLGNLINAVLEVGEADLGARLKMTEGGMKVDGSGSEG